MPDALRRLAATVIAAVVLAAPTLARAQVGTAAALYASGTDALDAERYADALRDCEAAALALVSAAPEQRGRAELCAARAAAGLDRTATAIRFAADALSHIESSGTRVRRYVRDLDAARTMIRELASRVGRVVLEIAPPEARERASVRIAGALVAPTSLGGPVAVDPGQVEIVVESPGYETARQQIDVPAGETRHLAVRLAAIAAPGPPTQHPPTTTPPSAPRRVPSPERADDVAPFRLSLGLGIGLVAITYAELELATGRRAGAHGVEVQPATAASLEATFRVAAHVRLGVVAMGAWLPDEAGTYMVSGGACVALSFGPLGIGAAVVLGSARAETDGVTDGTAVLSRADASFGLALDVRVGLARIGRGGPFVGARPFVQLGDDAIVLLPIMIGWDVDLG